MSLYKSRLRQIRTCVYTRMPTHVHAVEWDASNKGELTKIFFPIVNDRISKRLQMCINLSKIVTGRSKLRSYCHRFNIIHASVKWVHKPLIALIVHKILSKVCEHYKFRNFVNGKFQQNIFRSSKTYIWTLSKQEF